MHSGPAFLGLNLGSATSLGLGFPFCKVRERLSHLLGGVRGLNEIMPMKWGNSIQHIPALDARCVPPGEQTSLCPQSDPEDMPLTGEVTSAKSFSCLNLSFPTRKMEMTEDPSSKGCHRENPGSRQIILRTASAPHKHSVAEAVGCSQGVKEVGISRKQSWRRGTCGDISEKAAVRGAGR